VANLNQLLADTITLRDLYKSITGGGTWADVLPTHLNFRHKHYDEQKEIVDGIASAFSVGGVRLPWQHDVAEMSLIPREPKEREGAVPSQISRLLPGTRSFVEEARRWRAFAYYRRAATRRAQTTDGQRVIRRNETCRSGVRCGAHRRRAANASRE